MAYVVIAAILFIREKNIKQLLVMLLPLLGMVLLKYGVTQWLEVQENTGGVYTKNTYSSMSSKVTSGLTLYSLISAVCSALGSCWYMLAGTFMTAGLGILTTLKTHIFQDKKMNREKIFYLYALISWLFMLAVSVLATYRKVPATEGRTDLYYHGRYMEAAFGFFILMGLIWLWQKKEWKEKLREIVLCVLVFLCLSLLIHYVTTSYVDTGNNYFSVVAILLPVFYPTLTISVKASSIAAQAVSSLILSLYQCGRKTYRYFSAIVLCGVFLFTGYNATFSVAKSYIDVASVTNHPTANADFNDICARIRELDTVDFCVLASEATDAFSFQLVMNDMTVTGFTDESETEQMEPEDVIVIEKTDVSDLSGFEVLYENGSFYICLKNG